MANDEPWDDAEVEPHQEDLVEVRDADRAAHIEAGTRGEDGTAKPLWKATFLRHYLLRHRWLHGCDPAQVGGKGNKLADAATTTDTNAVVRVVVSGMKSSGKSHFLRALAPDQQVPGVLCDVRMCVRAGMRACVRSGCAVWTTACDS